jgi:excisionase family DNA binding protein
MSTRLLLTPTEAAQALGIGRSKLYELLRDGVVPSVTIGACRRIIADDLRAVIESLRAAAAAVSED